MLQLGQVPGVGSVDDLIDTTAVTPGDIFWALVVFLVAFVLGKLGSRWTRRFLAKFEELPPEIPKNAGRFVFSLILFTGVVYALSLLGVDTGPAMLLLLFFVALVFLAGRPLLENFGSGLVLQARHSFSSGDQIKSNDHTGTVVEVNSRATVIKTVDGRYVFIPNRDVLNNPLVNYTKEGKRRSTLTIGVEYGTDLRRAVAAVDEALAGVDTVLNDPAHQVLVNEFGDSSIDLLAWYWHAPEIDAEFLATDEATLAVKDALDVAGIVIAFPQRVLWQRNAGEAGRGGRGAAGPDSEDTLPDTGSTP